MDVLHHSPCVVNAPLDERIATIDEMVSDKYTVNLLCNSLCVSKGTYCNRKLRGKHSNTEANILFSTYRPSKNQYSSVITLRLFFHLILKLNLHTSLWLTGQHYTHQQANVHQP